MIEDKLFDTKEKKDLAVAQLKRLVDDAGWKIVLQVLDANIELIEDFVLSGLGAAGNKLTESETDQLRSELRIYKNVREMPKHIVESFSEKKTPTMPEYDPYLAEEEGIDKPAKT
jgi:hypothetical protein